MSLQPRFWLVPDAFRISSGDSVWVHDPTSSHFPTSEATVAPDRIADARIFSARDEARIREISCEGTSLSTVS